MSKGRMINMAARAATGFEQNAHTVGMAQAIRHAQTCGTHKGVFSCLFVWGLHQKITGHDLDKAYRTSEVSMGQFREHEIPHPSKIPTMMLALARDVNWLLTDCKDDTYSITARVMMRLVAMQPFQDGNKRTAFAVAAYVMAYRGMPGVLVPRMNDCKAFCDAVYDGDEGAVKTLVAKWHRRE
jgi:prophage maintenance system killer protein